MRPSPHRPLARAATLAATLATAAGGQGAPAPLPAATVQAVERAVATVTPQVVAWRRDIHRNPELGFRETRTAKLVADHLRALGITVEEGVGFTGVVGVLTGARRGPTVALRADMDALPVTERTGLPFASTVTTTYNGQPAGVMHACGHDTHTAILMGVASVLAGMRTELAGRVVFVFQPAEEGGTPPDGTPGFGGAAAMLKTGFWERLGIDAIYGLHSWPGPVGTVSLRSGGLMASSDNWKVVVRGRQTHGAVPWGGVDPVVAGAAILTELQSVVSRRLDLSTGPAVITAGFFNGGVRENIIPDSAVMGGTIRTFAPATRTRAQAELRRLAEKVAEAHGATATVTFAEGYPVTVNDPKWFPRAHGVLQRALGAANVAESAPSMPAEDFSRFLERAPGAFFFLGGTPAGTDPATVAPNHSPFYDVDERALPVGVKALVHLTLDALVHGVPKTAAGDR